MAVDLMHVCIASFQNFEANNGISDLHDAWQTFILLQSQYYDHNKKEVHSLPQSDPVECTINNLQQI